MFYIREVGFFLRSVLAEGIRDTDAIDDAIDTFGDDSIDDINIDSYLAYHL